MRSSATPPLLPCDIMSAVLPNDSSVDVDVQGLVNDNIITMYVPYTAYDLFGGNIHQGELLIIKISGASLKPRMIRSCLRAKMCTK